MEIEKRPSGVWTVLYQPGIHPSVKDAYQAMYDYVGTTIINQSRFHAMSQRHMACIQATHAYAEPMNTILSEFGFSVDKRACLIFDEQIDAPSVGTPQSGQNVLRIDNITSSSSVLSIIDPACYLYDIPYERMPIAVGDRDFIERAMSEVYSNAAGQTIHTKLVIL